MGAAAREDRPKFPRRSSFGTNPLLFKNEGVVEARKCWRSWLNPSSRLMLVSTRSLLANMIYACLASMENLSNTGLTAQFNSIGKCALLIFGCTESFHVLSGQCPLRSKMMKLKLVGTATPGSCKMDRELKSAG